MDSEIVKIQLLNLLKEFPDTFELEETEHFLLFNKKEKSGGISLLNFWSAFYDLQIDISPFIFGGPNTLYENDKENISKFINKEGDLLSIRRAQKISFSSLLYPELLRIEKSFFVKGVVVDDVEKGEYLDELEKYKKLHSLCMTPFLISNETEELLTSFVRKHPSVKKGFSLTGVMFDSARIVSWGISKGRIF